MLSYAQNFEDVILWRALRGIAHGCYLDIGAQHPLLDSVSRLFYEAGWRGVHVEAHPHFASQLRADRPDETVIEAAVTDAPGVIEFFDVARGGLSTGNADVARVHREAGLAVAKMTVPGITLAAIFDSIGPRDIHWMKIDVEGMEAKVVDGWGEAAARPWVVVIESTFPMSQTPTHDEWLGAILGRGYREVLFDGLNRYFLADGHPELAGAFAAPANIFDDFSVLPTHPLCRTAVERADADKAKLTERLAEDHANAAAAAAKAHRQHDAERRELAARVEALEQAAAAAQRAHDAERARLVAEVAESRRHGEETLATHERERQRLAAAADGLRGAMAALQQDHERDRQAFVAEAKRFERQAGVAERQQEAAGRQLVAAKRQHDEERQRLVEEIARLGQRGEQAMAVHADERRRAERAIERLRGQAEAAVAGAMARFADGRASRQGELDELRAAYAALARQGKAAEGTIARLSRLLDEMEAARGRQVAALRADVEQLKAGHAQQRQQLGVAHGQLAVAARAALTLRQQLAQGQSAMAALAAELMQRNTQLDHAAKTRAALDRAPGMRTLRTLRLVPRDPVPLPIVQGQLTVAEWMAAALLPAPHALSDHSMREFPMEKITHVDQLLVLNGSRFIEQAYRTFLKRSPDRGGFEHFLARLRAGDGKEAIVEAIASSVEARATGTEIEGVAALTARRRKPAGRFGKASGDTAAIERLVNRIEYSLSRQQEAFADKLEQLDQSLADIRASGDAAPRPDAAPRRDAAPLPDPAPRIASIRRQFHIEAFSDPADFIAQLKAQVAQSAEAAMFAPAAPMLTLARA